MGKAKKSKGKTSAVKIGNKRLNKLSKQGKLRKVPNKRKRQEKLSASSQKAAHKNEERQEMIEEELPLQEDDISFYGTPGQNLSFTSSIRDSLKRDKSSNRKSGKRKNEEENDEDEEDYEQLPRKLFVANSNKNMKMILPIKTKQGIVPRMVEDEEGQEEQEESEDNDDQNEAESHDLEADQSEPEPLPVLSSVELYALRQKKLAERKSKIASLAQEITENPEQNIKMLKELVQMLYEKDSDVLVTVRKLVMISLMELFKDIVPGYHIRLPTEKEQKQKMKKETIQILAHEEGLLKAYRHYLEFLEQTAKGQTVKNNSKFKQEKETDIPKKAQQGLTELSVKCMCEMLTSHPHFNYRNNIIAVIVWYMNHKRPEVSDIVCDSVRQLFKEDKAGHITLELTKCIGRMIKTKDFRIQPKVLETFLSLRITEVSYTNPIEQTEKKKKHLDKLSRRDRKRKKRMILLEKELMETKASQDKKQRLKLHTETIQAVFLTYFRILKKATKSVLLPSVLEGLAKFAHLISVDFFEDLFTVFKELIQSEDLSYRESLHCVQTAFTILSGQGSALKIDPINFYRHLYNNLFHVHAGCTGGDIPIVLECLDVMVNKRKRQVSQQRILAFLKRLSTLVLQQTADGALGLLAAIRNFCLTYSYSDMLFDNEAQGSGTFLPELPDPEHCHAQNTTLWELSYLQKHYHPTVQKYAKHVSSGSPSTGEGQLTPDLRRSPLSMYNSFRDEDVLSNLSEKCKHPKRKRYMNGLIQRELSDQVLSVLSSVPDEPRQSLLQENR